jgi:ubiquitin-protein ligase
MMARRQRPERMTQECKVLEKLAEQSSILSFSGSQDLAGGLELLFQGRGYCWADRQEQRVEMVQQHRVRLVMPEDYPDSPPVIEWESDPVHPTLSPDAFLAWEDLQIEWDPKMKLDLICERIWDLIRGADGVGRQDWEAFVSTTAGGEASWSLPADARRLGDRAATRRANVIQYRRKHVNVHGAKVGPAIRKEVPCSSDANLVWEHGIQFVDEAKPESQKPDAEDQIWFLDDQPD